MAMKPIHGIVILLFDTLRSDFQSINKCSRNNDLSSFKQLQNFTYPLKQIRCGSFPTIPMRTDLLTGTLSFLSRRWARPRTNDTIFTNILSEDDIKTFLVTDNYMMTNEELGGTFKNFFDETIEIRGTASDPWKETDSEYKPSNLKLRPTRNTDFQAQFLSNLKAWNQAGGPPWERLFDKAADLLMKLCKRKKEKFLLWVDCFSTHEPWIQQSDLKNLTPSEPIYPPYGDSRLYTNKQINSLKHQYCNRLSVVDTALNQFVESLSQASNSGVATMILSDHGFLLGEYGLVGKPKTPPVLPPLSDLVCRVSRHFESLLKTRKMLQPCDLTPHICDLFDVRFPVKTPIQKWPNRPQLIGRNSPEVTTLSVANQNGVGFIFRNLLNTEPRWHSWDSLEINKGWQEQSYTQVPSQVKRHKALSSLLKNKAWGSKFTSFLTNDDERVHDD